MRDINSEITTARETLRNIHDKYLKEFHDIHLKIDSYLEKLQAKQNKQEVSEYK